ncbi:3-oxoacyl-[acyl-carrier-protein] reductase FabG [Marinovum algicola]|uniref:3-oxoacyl-[acyl-carrier protein] reductase n=1 Tax=Marinovum algicola TaxID=42444 RepID=A0A975WBV4_9RHOB|nr:SDR family oxidoreductase [Marinovum algicola]SEJ82691.1 3-oxoacyl-[acyl-carrier protein] reductase [Marinovum algicola]SLN62806.1 3-oxoacyl-[acyl-carrier-protein] reductase FabG [Marinovum algicola]
MTENSAALPLAGKVAIVTGAGRGLGRAYALRLASLGADVVASDINLDSARDWNEELTADSVQAEVETLGRRSIAVQADMSNPEDVARLFDDTKAAFGRLDILVNNAGGAIARDSGPLATQTSQSDYDLLMDANLRSCLLACQAAARLMNGGGSIINVTSQTAVSTLPGGPLAIYGAAKAGVTVLTRCLAAELGPQGIRVNAIAPGIIMTSRVAAQAAERGLGTNAQAEGLPLRRLGQVEDCAGVIEFLARDLSQYVTGQVICADGGAVLNAS